MSNKNYDLFKKWIAWKDNSLNVYKQNQPMHINSNYVFTLFELGLHEGEDYQISASEIRFRNKTDLSLFKVAHKERI